MSGVKRPSSIVGLSAALDTGKKATLPVVGDVSPGAKPVRLNLDIDRELHRWLKGFALQADSDVAHVVRSLLAELQTDDALADKVRARLAS